MGFIAAVVPRSTDELNIALTIIDKSSGEILETEVTPSGNTVLIIEMPSTGIQISPKTFELMFNKRNIFVGSVVDTSFGRNLLRQKLNEEIRQGRI